MELTEAIKTSNEIMKQHFTDEEYDGFLKGIWLINTFVNEEDKEAYWDLFKQLYLCNSQCKCNETSNESNLQPQTRAQNNEIQIGDYIKFRDNFYQKTESGIVSKIECKDYYLKDGGGTFYNSSSDKLLKYIPKLRDNKWYNSKDFTVEELSALLPIGTKVLVKYSDVVNIFIESHVKSIELDTSNTAWVFVADKPYKYDLFLLMESSHEK